MSLDYSYAHDSGAKQSIISQDQVYVLLHADEKRPITSDWQNRPVSLADFNSENYNLGLLLGADTGFVDVDCDSAEAVHLAKCLLLKPYAHFQRSSSSGHYIYRCPDAGKTVQRGYDGTLIELRSTGGQTMIPPSVHPDGDTLEWSLINEDAGGREFADLMKLVNLIAAGCLVAQAYSEGSRHWLSLGFAGLLRKAGVQQEECEKVIKGIAEWGYDQEDRIANVRTTYQQDIQSVAGYRLLQEHLDQAVLEKICNWLGVPRELTALNGEVLDHRDSLPDVQAITSETISEAVLAENFVRKIEGKHCFVPQDRQWRYWNDTRWMPDDRNVLGASFMDFLRSQKASANDYRVEESLQKFETSYKADSVAKLSQANCAVESDAFDRKDHLLNCPNGVFDLNSGMLKTHNPLDYLSKQTTTAYDPEATAPRFEQFVLEICNDEEGLAGYLQRIAGYALEGGNPEQVMFILHGRGANGKSTFVEVCSDVLGSYTKTAPSSVLIEARSGGVGDDLVFLKGARWINASETGQGSYLAENKLKQITGGDTTAGRALYAAYQEFQISGVVLFSTNHLPRVRGTDEGIWRRLNVIEFNRTFTAGQRDPHLKDTLLAERSGVLNWMLEGHRQYKANGLQPPECVQRATRLYRNDMDVVSGFLEECCQFDAERRTQQTILKGAFERFCYENGRGETHWSDLKTELEARGSAMKKSRGNRFWSGIKLKDS